MSGMITVTLEFDPLILGLYPEVLSSEKTKLVFSLINFFIQSSTEQTFSNYVLQDLYYRWQTQSCYRTPSLERSHCLSSFGNQTHTGR